MTFLDFLYLLLFPFVSACQQTIKNHFTNDDYYCNFSFVKLAFDVNLVKKVNFWSLSTFFSETIRVSEMKQIALDAESFRDGFKAR